MSDLTVDLVTPWGVVIAGTKIPTDYTVKRIIDEIVEELALPTGGQEGPIYSLKWNDKDVTLGAEETLISAGLHDGDRVTIVSSAQSAEAGTPLHTGQAVEVVVWVLDLHQSSHETFDSDVTVADVLGRLRKKYRLSEPHYRLESTFLGRVLNAEETLHSARIPHGDKLAVLREEVAGGGSVSDLHSAGLGLLDGEDVPRALAQFLKFLDTWARENDGQARRDALKFWSLKAPAIAAASGAGLIASLRLPSFIPIVIGAVSAILVALDGIVRPGAMYSVHKRAFHDIRGLQMSMASQWSIALLKNKASDAAAALILAQAEKRRIVIAGYLKTAEAAIYLDTRHTSISAR